MSIRKKLTLLILVAFIGNIIFIIAYYDLNLSKEMMKSFNEEQLVLDNEMVNTLNEIEHGKPLDLLIKDIEKNNNKTIIVINNEKGDILYEGKGYEEEGLNQQVSAIVNTNNQRVMIKIIKPIDIRGLLVTKSIRRLLKAEFFIISLILVILAVMIYLNLVKPIEKLRESMSKYKIGIKPERVSREDEIGWLYNCFADLTDDIDKERDKQNRIIASISHDIKTPLTSVMGFAERLQSGRLEESRREKYLRIIYSKSEDIKNIINEFDEYLDYNLQREINRENISLEKLCNIIKEDYFDELSDMNVGFSIECNNENSILNIDIAKIRRVFGNIITNSIKHRREEPLNIKITGKKLDNYFLFQIEDNGTGIYNDNIERIFEPLYTSDKSRKVAGLGLSICKDIIKSHFGEIWVKNNEDYGLSVFFTIKNLENS